MVNTGGMGQVVGRSESQNANGPTRPPLEHNGNSFELLHDQLTFENKHLSHVTFSFLQVDTHC